MNSYRIAICLKNNPSRMIGTFFANEDGMVKLENAFFESNSKIVFPTIVISESDIAGVARVEDGEARGAAEDDGDGSTGIHGSEHVEGEFRIDSEISNARRSSAGGARGSMVEDCGEMQSHAEASQEGKDWNQFEANSKLFNIDGRFEEQEYMEVIDRTCEVYKAKVSMAKKIESEIMHSTTNDQHRLEERGMKVNKEEDTYSSVIGGKAEAMEDVIDTETPFERRKDKAMKQKSNTARRRMVIEIEGLPQDRGTENSGSIDECSRADKGMGEVGRSTRVTDDRKANGSVSKGVTYGWMNTQFESIDRMLNAIKSKFAGKLTNVEDQKWGAGPSWKIGAKNIISRSMKMNKTQLSGNKQMIKKGSIMK
ncbi:LsmAD domain-containing protein [Ordospora pajunii]|uniref:LsmAD domain-containing protein n=1 Tax=Ordospora pajunii TaxID=3039483 RepID=UPI00295263DC|nr:LsmAD domain-containing protein [Ordospora pajunii]KAH9410628.1 LsmAD domain-containing protein [Ordospora pajunii]